MTNKKIDAITLDIERITSELQTVRMQIAEREHTLSLLDTWQSERAHTAQEIARTIQTATLRVDGAKAEAAKAYGLPSEASLVEELRQALEQQTLMHQQKDRILSSHVLIEQDHADQRAHIQQEIQILREKVVALDEEQHNLLSQKQTAIAQHASSLTAQVVKLRDVASTRRRDAFEALIAFEQQREIVREQLSDQQRSAFTAQFPVTTPTERLVAAYLAFLDALIADAQSVRSSTGLDAIYALNLTDQELQDVAFGSTQRSIQLKRQSLLNN